MGGDQTDLARARHDAADRGRVGEHLVGAPLRDRDDQGAAGERQPGRAGLPRSGHIVGSRPMRPSG